jgi:hypothetical protein
MGAAELATRLSEYPGERPVVLWTAAAWRDRLAFWWVLDAIGRTAVDRDRFWVAEPSLAGRPHDPDPRLGTYMPREFRQAFGSLRPLQAGTVRSGTALWRAYAKLTPLAFDRARRQGSRLFPDLVRIGDLWGSSFPWAVGSRLRLSDADRVLLWGLRTDRWVTFGGVIGNLSHREIFFLLAREPDIGRLRLLRWVGHDTVDPAVLTLPGPNGRYESHTAVYRLTAKGKRLLEDGLDRPGEAPPLWVGGCCAYDEKTTWVRRGEERDWRIERL